MRITKLSLFQSLQIDICLKCLYGQGNGLWFGCSSLCMCVEAGGDSVPWEEILQPHYPLILSSQGKMHESVPELRPSTPRLPSSSSTLPPPPFLPKSLPSLSLGPSPTPTLAQFFSPPLAPSSSSFFSSHLIPFPSSIPPRRLRQAPTCVTRGVWVGAVH